MRASLYFDGTEVPPAEFEDAVLRAAAGFERLGVGEGDVVCLMLRNHPAFLEALLGARRLGAYTCPVNWHFKADEAGWILRDSGAKVLVVEPDLLAQVKDGVPPSVAVVEADTRKWRDWLSSHPRHAGPECTARYSMPYTSGTTGRPKGVRRIAPSPADAAGWIEAGKRTGRINRVDDAHIPKARQSPHDLGAALDVDGVDE